MLGKGGEVRKLGKGRGGGKGRLFVTGRGGGKGDWNGKEGGGKPWKCKGRRWEGNAREYVAEGEFHESVVVPKANVGVEIIIVSDGDGDDDKEVVGDTMGTIVARPDDEIDSVAVGMSRFILEACLGAMEGGSLEATPSGYIIHQRKQFSKLHLKVTWKINCPMSNKVEMWEISSLFQHAKAKGSRTKRRPEMVTCEGSKPEAIP
ncbi:hypothetical protein Tco_0103486 [Tanacetum coccineum]